jgi:transcriptional regulator with PAS, ATPase and Fis domain
MTLAAVIRREVLQRLIRNEFHAKRTARSLGIGNSSMYRWLKTWDLVPVVPAKVLRQLTELEETK